MPNGRRASHGARRTVERRQRAVSLDANHLSAVAVELRPHDAVVLGEELDSNRVFTTDRKDFSVYRLKGRQRFEILPG